ncbi:MAG: ABC transporter permease [Actinobacteria bacterium]|jgi:peptide/nickel transport system permease protein|nr:ABC transporter permease [Actinomycetota bacterium]
MRMRIIGTNLAKFVTVLVLVTFGITVLVRLLPGDPVETLMPFATEEAREAVREELGLKQSIVPFYLDWLRDFATGNLGEYFSVQGDGTGVPLSSMLSVSIQRSLLLMLYTTFFSLLFAIPLGLLMAYRAETRTDRVISNSLFAVASIPNFAIGLGLAFIVGVKLNWLPVLGYVPINEGLGAHVKSMVLPVVSLSLGLISTFSRLLRVDTIATLREDFVTMASSKGLSNTWILWRHVLRPSSSTLLTSAALNMGSLIGGAVVVETVFALNGFGMLLAASIAQRQYMAIQSLVALVAIAYMAFNLIVDVLYAVVDPRVASHRGS